MNKNIFLSLLIFICSIQSLFAYEQKLELVVGIPEAGDIRYGIEWKYGGVALTPGLGFLTVTAISDDEIIPIIWNPSISYYKTWMLNSYFGLTPNITGMYMYGYGGMLGGNGFEVTKTRFDAIYLMERIGIRVSGKKMFFEINPGYGAHYEYEVIRTGGKGLDLEKAKKWVSNGLEISASIGIKI
jgi:hypothetical protein